MRSTRLAAALGTLLLLAPLAACAPGTDVTPTGTPRAAAIDVDTPTLRREKAAAGIAACPATPDSAVEGGLPQETLPCFGGGRDVELARLRGPLVVNVWASYCAPCRTEMPLLEQFHRRYGSRIGVLGVDFQDPQTESAMTLARRSKVTYPLVADTQGVFASARPARVIGLPTTILIDAQGRVRRVEAVELTSVQQLVDLVREHLGVTL